MIRKLLNCAKHKIKWLAYDHVEYLGYKDVDPSKASNEELIMLAISRLETRINRLEKRL